MQGVHVLWGEGQGRDGGGRESGCSERCKGWFVKKVGVWKGEEGDEVGKMVVPDPGRPWVLGEGGRSVSLKQDSPLKASKPRKAGVKIGF